MVSGTAPHRRAGLDSKEIYGWLIDGIIVVLTALEQARSVVSLLEAASADVARRLPQAAFGTRASTLASAAVPELLHPAWRDAQ